MSLVYPKNVTDLRKSEFIHLNGATYLDFAGSGVYGKSQLDSYFADLQENLYGNPHSNNPSSNLTTSIINQVRENVLKFFNVSSEEYECIFTQNATSALHIIASSFDWSNNSVFAYLEDNHTSVVGIRKSAIDYGAQVYCLENTTLGKNENIFDLKNDFSSIEVACDAIKCEVQVISNCLFAYSAQSNFNGQKYPLSWNENQIISDAMEHHIPLRDSLVNRKWFVLCDAASYATTSTLDLTENSFDFIPISFYKLFGFPTGVGALLVHKSAAGCLQKRGFFGGGSAKGWLSSENFYLPHQDFQATFEDGTVAFLDIVAIQHGLNFFKKLKIDSMKLVQDHTFLLIRKMYEDIKSLKHTNGNMLVDVYSYNSYTSNEFQGPIIAFNLLDMDGNIIGYNKVLELASLWNIHLRSGCFCNIGACAKHLKIPISHLKKSFHDGTHSCGDSVDVMNGVPMGALRVSIGYCSTEEDVCKFIKFLRENFILKLNLSMASNSLHHTSKLEEIMLYPVKSCRGMSVKSWRISDSGLVYDRYWMVVDEKNVFRSLKKNTNMALVQAKVDIDTGILTLQYKGNGMILEKLTCKFIQEDDIDQSSLHSFKMFNEVNWGIDCGTDANEWISQAIGSKSRLIQLVKKRNGHLSLVNKSQYMLINKGSVEHLCNVIKNSQIDCDEDLHSVCDAEMLKYNFRANFIVSGVDAFCEETWKTVQVNEVLLTTPTVCSRCSLISVDPFTGQTLPEPLKSLFVNLKKRNFGIYLTSSANDSIIHAGTNIRIMY